MQGQSAYAVGVLIVLFASGVHGQVPDREAHLRALFARTDSSALWRIQSTTGDRFQGRVLRLDSTFLYLDEGPPIPLAQVERGWERGRAWLVGGLIGALLVGAALGADCATEGAEVNCPVGAVTIRGAALGFGLGAGVGVLIPKWHQLYP